MSEQQLQDAEEAVDSDLDGAAAPAPEASSDAAHQPKPSRPMGFRRSSGTARQGAFAPTPS